MFSVFRAQCSQVVVEVFEGIKAFAASILVFTGHSKNKNFEIVAVCNING